MLGSRVTLLYTFTAGVLAGCGGSSSGSVATGGSAGSAAPAIACYEGTSTMTGQSTPGLVRRTVDRAQHHVLEEVWQATADGNPSTFLVDFVVADDGTYTLQDQSSTFTGTGAFTAGAPWAWTAWKSDVTATAGGWSATSVDTLDGATLVVTKTLTLVPPPEAPSNVTAGPDRIEITERYTALDCAELDARRAALKLTK